MDTSAQLCLAQYVVSTSVFEAGSMGQSRVKGIYECSPRNPELIKNSGTMRIKCSC